MLSFAIIVFREALEIALVLGALFAGTRGMAGKGRWIAAGFAAGLVGSGVVAIFTDALSSSFEGIGQEAFQALVLSLAAVLIGVTVIWMKRHSRSLAAGLYEAASEIRAGKRPLYALAIIVSLAVLRDGAEIVLLAHGVLASGQDVLGLMTGGALGLIAGTAVGCGIYYGLIKAAARHIFAVTSWLLIVLAAGMASQAIGYLTAVDLIHPILYPVWDSSWLLSESSLLGQTMSVLVGYTARPSAMQLLVYVGTLAVIGAGLRFAGRDGAPFARAVTALAAGIAFATASDAHAIDKIYSPIVEEGELEIETRGTYTFDDREDRDDAYKQLIGMGYGFTDRIAADAYMELKQEPQSDTDVQAVLGEVRFQLFEQGEYFLDSGLYLELERDIVENEWEVEGKILLEKSTGDFTHTLNVIFGRAGFERHAGSVELETALKTRYRYSQAFEPGIELFDSFGDIDDMGSWNEEEHAVGPAVYGKLFGSVRYEIACLFGISDSAGDNILRWMVELEL